MRSRDAKSMTVASPDALPGPQLRCDCLPPEEDCAAAACATGLTGAAWLHSAWPIRGVSPGCAAAISAAVSEEVWKPRAWAAGEAPAEEKRGGDVAELETRWEDVEASLMGARDVKLW